MLDKATLIHSIDNFYKALNLPLFLLDEQLFIQHQCSSFFPTQSTFFQKNMPNFTYYSGKLDIYISQQELYAFIPYCGDEIKHVCIGPVLLSRNQRNANVSYCVFFKQLEAYIEPSLFLNKIGFVGNDILPKIKLLYQLLCDDTLSTEEIRMYLHKDKETWSNTIVSNYLYQNREDGREYGYQNHQKFLHYISLGDSITARAYAQKTIDYGVGNMSDDELRKFKYAFVSTVTLIARTAIKAGVSVSSSYSLSDVYINKADCSYQMDDLMHIYNDCIIDYCVLIKRSKDRNIFPLWVRECMEYIENNSHNEITLQDLGEHVHMAPAYISVQFKAITKQSLKEYTNRQKVKEAQFLLQSTSMSIQDIAMTLQYSTQSYFARIFKQYSGVLPNIYRKNNT